MKKATISEEKRSQAHGNPITPHNAPTKISRALVTLLQRSLNRFEAEALGDHCLHSTISKLSNDYGLKFVRKSECVPNNWGTPCRVIRYSLPASERKRAQALLKLLCSAAGAKREAA